jgi:hypothetical protein
MLVRVVRGVLVGVLSVLITAGTAHAADPVADLALTGSVSAIETYATSGTINVPYYQHNYGPTTGTGTHLTDIWAPGGTEFAPGYPTFSGCVTIVPKKHIQCRNWGSIWIDGQDNASMEGTKLWVNLKIVSKNDLTCGKVRLSYGGDPKTSNNTAYLRVTYGGKPSSCTVKPSSSPRPSRSPAASPSRSASASAAPRTSPSSSADPTTEPTSAESSIAVDPITGPAVLVGDEDGSFGSATVLAAGAVLVGAGAALLWWRRRRRDDDGGHAAP